MIEHDHCFCFPICLTESHTGFELDERGRRKAFTRENNTRDTMCCHCGAFKDGKLRFIQEDNHGILRHRIWHAPKEGKK